MVTKRKLCMASGGVLPKTSDDAPKDKKPAGWKEGLVAALRAIKGEGEGRKTEGSPAPTIENARNAIVDRKAANRSVLNYARGGVLPVIGIGSGTSDSISAVVDGQKVGLSNGEGFATLPAKTMKTPGAVDAVETIIQATNDGKPPVPTKAGGRAKGGTIKPNFMSPAQIGAGIKEAIIDPIAEDWKQGNVAIKNLRDQYPTADNVAGMHPAVAAAQVANDVMADGVDGGTAINAMQAIPLVKRVTGLAARIGKDGMPINATNRIVMNMPATLKKNAVLTAGQTLGQPANAFANGVAGAANAFPQTAGAIRRAIPAARNALEDGNYVGAIGQVGRGAALAATGLAKDINNSAAYALGVPVNALKTFATGDSSPAVPAPGATLPTQPLPAQQTPVTSAAADRAVGVPEIPVPQAPAAQTPAAAAPRIQSFDAGTEGADRVRNLIADRGFVPNRGQGLITSSSGGATVLNTPAAEATAPETVTLDALVQERARRALAGDVAGAHALNGSIASMQAANTAGVLVEKGRGEVADSAAARIAREGLGAAYDSGDQEAVNKATLKAIAAGVLSPPRNNSPYEIKTDPLGNQTRLNSSTGMSETLDRATNTWKPIGSAAEVPEFASESDVRSAQKAGKLKVGQKVMVGGRMATVTAD